MSLPTIQSYTHDATGLTVTAVDGNVVTITSVRILAYQHSLKGHTAPFGPPSLFIYQTTLAWVCRQIADTLGWKNVDPSQVGFSYNMATGAPTTLTIG